MSCTFVKETFLTFTVVKAFAILSCSMPCSHWEDTKCRAVFLIKHPPPLADFLTCCPLCKSTSLPVSCLETTRYLLLWSYRLPLAITTDHANFWQVFCYFNLKLYFHPTNKSRIFFSWLIGESVQKLKIALLMPLFSAFEHFKLILFFTFSTELVWDIGWISMTRMCLIHLVLIMCWNSTFSFT